MIVYKLAIEREAPGVRHVAAVVVAQLINRKDLLAAVFQLDHHPAKLQVRQLASGNRHSLPVGPVANILLQPGRRGTEIGIERGGNVQRDRRDRRGT